MSASPVSLPVTPKICAYFHRQGSKARCGCDGVVTPLDVQGAYCSKHYKLKCVQPVPVDLRAVKEKELEDQITKMQQEIERMAKFIGATGCQK